MSNLLELTTRLRKLATRRPTAESRAEVATALQSKWEGVQAVAVEVLTEWGGRECIDQLRQFLTRCFERPRGWGIRHVVVREIQRIVTGRDVDWVLDLYFALLGWLPKHELLRLVIALPADAARERLVNALSDPRWDNRHAAVKAIGNMDFPDRWELLDALRDDPNKDVRASVELLAPRPNPT
jgi:HEAT repeat protein